MIEKVINYFLIEVVCDEIIELLIDVIIVVVIGFLISDVLVEKIYVFNDGDGFYFYDAAVFIIDVNIIDMSKVYFKFCYDKGEAVYFNVFMIK